MSSSIHYKFRATLDYKLLEFEGLSISVADCKREICLKENIKAESFDLLLQNSHTKRNYTADELIPRNSSIIVQRVPRENAEKLPKIQSATSGMVGKTAMTQPAPSAGVTGHVDAETFDSLTEEQRLAHIKDVSASKYTPANYQKRTNQIMSGPPPPTYTCNRCYQPGHWYKNCPMLNTKRTTGIPGDELMETTPDDPQAMITGTGKYVIPIMHWRARNSKRPDNGEVPLSQRVVPPELKCALCDELLKEAMLSPCCGESFCADCISNKLMEVTECPHCKKDGVGVDQLVPNKSVRLAVDSWAGNTTTASVAGFAEKSQPLPPDRRARTRLRIGIGAGGTTPQSEMDGDGGNTPGQEVDEQQQTLQLHQLQTGGEQPLPPGISLDPQPLPPGVIPVTDAAAAMSNSVQQAFQMAASASLPVGGDPLAAAAAGGAAVVAVPVAAFQPHVPPPPIPPQGGTVVLIDPLTQQPIFNPQFAGQSVLPGGEVYQASSSQLMEAWEEYKNRDRGEKKEKREGKERERSPKKNKKRKRSRSASSDSSSSSSSSTSSSSGSDRDRKRRRDRDGDRSRYGRDNYHSSSYGGYRGRGRGGYRGRAGFYSGMPRGGMQGVPAGAVMVMGPDGIPRYTMQYPMQMPMQGVQTGGGVYAAAPAAAAGGVVQPGQPTSLLEGGEIVPPDGLVYLDAYGQVIPRAIIPLEDGRDPRDSRPPHVYSSQYRGDYRGGYRGRGRGANYERMEADRRYREDMERRRRRDDRGDRRDHDDRRERGGGDRDRDRDRDERDDRRRHDHRDEHRERDDDRHRRREKRDRSEERRREEEAIEATIKDLEENPPREVARSGARLHVDCERIDKIDRVWNERRIGEQERLLQQMCDGTLGRRSSEGRRRSNEGVEEKRGERGDRRRDDKEKEKERRKRKDKKGDDGEKENDKEAPSPVESTDRSRKRKSEEKMEKMEGEERRETKKVKKEEEGEEKEKVKEETMEDGSQAGEDGSRREKKQKKHKKHKKEKKAKKDKRQTQSDDESAKKDEEGEKEEKEGENGEEEGKEKKHKHKKNKKEKKEKKSKKERHDSVSDEDEKEKRKDKKEDKSSQESQESLSESIRDEEMHERSDRDESEKRKEGGEKGKGSVDITQVFQQAPIVQKKITLHLSK